MGGRGRFSRAWAIAAMVFGGAAEAQSLLYTPPPGAAAPPAFGDDPHCSLRIPFEDYVGKKIAFLAKTKQFQPYGYQSYQFSDRPRPYPSYAELAGKTGTIVAIGKDGSSLFQKAFIKIDETGKIVSAYADDHLPDIVFLQDIEFARSHYVGKTLWVNKPYARLNQDIEAYDGIRIAKYSAVKIVDVVPGTNTRESVDFVATTASGATILIPASVGTSDLLPVLLPIKRKYGQPLCDIAEEFSFENPRAKFNWPDSVWKNIELGHVVVGMTYEQVVMAKGDPDQVNQITTAGSSSARMVYGRDTFIYVNSKHIVTAIEN